MTHTAEVVLLHGWGMRSTVFDTLAGALSGRYRVHAPELPGYGPAPACEPYSLEAMSAALAAGAPRRCAVVGWSLGGQIALDWARERAEQVVRLVLLATTPCFVRRPAWDDATDPMLLLGFQRALETDRMAALMRFAGLQARGAPCARRVNHALRACLARSAPPATWILARGLELLRDTDLRPMLHAVRQPTLVVHGRCDGMTPLRAGAFLARALPRGRLAVVEAAAHAPFLSRPGEVAALVAQHLDE